MGCSGLIAPWHVGSSQARARTCVPCIGRQILYHWAILSGIFSSSHLPLSKAQASVCSQICLPRVCWGLELICAHQSCALMVAEPGVGVFLGDEGFLHDEYQVWDCPIHRVCSTWLWLDRTGAGSCDYWRDHVRTAKHLDGAGPLTSRALSLLCAEVCAWASPGKWPEAGDPGTPQQVTSPASGEPWGICCVTDWVPAPNQLPAAQYHLHTQERPSSGTNTRRNLASLRLCFWGFCPSKVPASLTRELMLMVPEPNKAGNTLHLRTSDSILSVGVEL